MHQVCNVILLFAQEERNQTQDFQNRKAGKHPTSIESLASAVTVRAIHQVSIHLYKNNTKSFIERSLNTKHLFLFAALRI